MELTGAAKEAFEKWYNHKYNSVVIGVFDRIPLDKYYLLPDSMKWGVYVDWFDSVGLIIDMTYSQYEVNGFWFGVFKGKYYEFVEFDSNDVTRHEARTEAIKKGDELFNNQEK